MGVTWPYLSGGLASALALGCGWQKSRLCKFWRSGESTCASSDWMPCAGSIALLANSVSYFVKDAVLLDRVLFVFAMGNNVVCSCWLGWLALTCLVCFIVSLGRLSSYLKARAEQTIPLKPARTTFSPKMSSQYLFTWHCWFSQYPSPENGSKPSKSTVWEVF